MEKVKVLPPFKRFCATIGNLPSSYVESLSYYECLMWLCNYLKETVVPTVNENAEAVNELINWFNNLDVQDEIDHKLDEMVEDGTMATIINQEVFGQLNDDIDSLEEDISTINSNITSVTNLIHTNESKPTIFIGDSYGNDENEWADIVSNLILSSEENITSSDLYNWCTGAASAVPIAGSGNKSYIQIMQENESLVDDPDKIKRIVLVAGYNDRYQNKANNYSALHTFYDYCRTTYPNAKVYFGCVGWDSNYENNSIRHTIMTQVLPAYKEVTRFGGIYLSGIEYSLHYYKNIWKDDGYHPNEEGEKIIGFNVYNMLNNSGFSYDSGVVAQGMVTTVFSSASGNIVYDVIDRELKVLLSDVNMGTPASTITITAGGLRQTIDLGLPTSASDILRNVNTLSRIPITANVIGSDNARYSFPAEFYVGNDGHYYINIYKNVLAAITVSNIILEGCLSIDRILL